MAMTLAFLQPGCGDGSPPATEPAAAQPVPPASPPAPAPAPASTPTTTPTPQPDAIGARLEPGPLAWPDDAMVSVREFGATGDGLTDDTEALQRALRAGREPAGDFFGRPKVLYFPPGIYLVRDSLAWEGCCVTLQGSGTQASRIRLAAAAPGFGSADAPKAVVRTPPGNQSFRQQVRDLGISVGPGNPAAIALDFISSNSGAVVNVELASEDGRGATGLSMVRPWPGPLLVRDLRVSGFDVGIDIAQGEYGPVLEHVTLSGQRVAGLRNRHNTTAVRSLDSANAVPALLNQGGLVVLLDARLNGGDPAAAAIHTDSALYARGVRSSGYGVTLCEASSSSTRERRGDLVEHLTGSATSLGRPLRAQSLGLPVREPPAVEADPPPAWAAFRPQHYGDTRTLQALFDSGARTVYFPSGAYLAFDERVVRVPPGVRRVIGFSSVINGDANGVNGGGIVLVVEEGTEPLVVEQFGYGLKIEHRGPRPLVLRHGGYRYASTLGAGPLFLDDVETGAVTIQPGQRVWARQWNNEHAGTKITNAGGDLWILGLKTEAAGTVIDTGPGGRTELLGTIIYPSRRVPVTDVAFRARDAQLSLIYTQPVYCTDCGYATQVSETIGEQTRTVPSDPGATHRMPLFVGF